MEEKNQQEVPDIQLSKPVREILKKMPNWFLISGNILLLCFVCMFLLFSWIVNYPDIIRSEIIITSENPHMAYNARSEGQVVFLHEDGDLVAVGENLAYIKNGAEYEDVISVKNELASIDIETVTEEMPIDRNRILGELQNAYLAYKNAVNQYVRQKLENPAYLDIEGMEVQHEQMKQLLVIQKENLENFKHDVELSRNALDRVSQLYKKSYATKVDLERAEKEVLMLERQKKSLEIQIAQTRISISELGLNIQKLKNQLRLQDKQILVDYYDKKKVLLSMIDNWELQYVIESTIVGRVSLLNFWKNESNVRFGEQVVVVVPESETKIYGKAAVPLQNSGKIETGQKAIVKLINYNSKEFGSLIGEVQKVASVPNNNTMLIDVSLPNGFTTNYGKQVAFSQEMIGVVEIVTEDISLLERYFYNIRDIFQYNQ